MPDIDALIADARRAVTPGAIGASPNRLDVLVGAQMPGGGEIRTAPRASGLDVSIDGPGLFVFELGRQRRFARLGDFNIDAGGYLTNAAGAKAMGFAVDAIGNPVSGLSEIRIPAADIASHRFATYELDERGVFSGVSKRIDARTGSRIRQNVALGRLAIAIVPAPERLALDHETMLAPTAAAGSPIVGVPGDAGMARLRTHSLESGMVDLEGDLARLWAARRRAEFAQLAAASTDQNARTALGLVK
jgi:flagellar hook protein FlgE